MSHVSVAYCHPCCLSILRYPNVSCLNVTCLCRLFLHISSVTFQLEEIPMSHVCVTYFCPYPMSPINFEKFQSHLSLLFIFAHALCHLSILRNPNVICLCCLFCPSLMSILKNPNVTCLCYLYLPMSLVAFNLEEIPISHVSVAYFCTCSMAPAVLKKSQ